ncbi:prohead protease/major capsid protein fusion protein [Rhabdaerophilum calidifontis]|jgi:ribosomal protein S25|uniref:prohead protease/major capsid protein fusion protein n=1 Tax=Rhabdaerophilum calidifontis TaxID=2604328 RepID=UPI00123C1478|nr:prohead protease/major capsid protein fusion protein [Rhabdaerophilum calidifontis]
MTRNIDLPPLTRAADLLPASIDAAERTIEVVWSTGARVRRTPFFGDPFDEELAMDPRAVRLDRLNAGAPLLKVHDASVLDSVIGSVVPGSARIENGRGIARVRFSDRTEVEPLWKDVEAGHIRAVSIGYQVHRFEVTRQAGAPELWRAVDWTPFEISAVPIGADPAAGFRAETSSESSLPLHPCVVHRADAPSKEKAAMDDAVTDNTETQTRQAAPEPQDRVPTTPVIDAETIAARARDSERERVGTIYDLAGRLHLERSFADDLVKRGVTLDAARSEILDKVATDAEKTRVSPQVSIPLGGRDERVTRRDAVSNALLHRYSPTLFPLSEPAREYRGMTLVEHAREFLSSSGVNVRGMSRDEIATRALHSTSDFPEVLAAVTGKTLRQAYDAYPRTYVPFCRQVLATDFKAMHRVQLGEAPQLVKVNEGGEFKRGTLAEGRESYRVETYGRVVAVTRQVLINDDLDAFTRIPAMYGTAIATLESDVVWGIILANAAMSDSIALFHQNHGNLANPATALSVTAIGAARAAMARQTGLDKKTILNVRPAYLIVPASLELAAEQLVAQNLVPAQTGNVVPSSIRTLTPISEPRLDAASLTAWYLAANPAQIDTIEYAYLEGQQGAYIETRNGFDVDGVEIKCRLDFGAKAIDWRGLYRNPGA